MRDAERVSEFRTRAERLRDQAERMLARARSLGPGMMADMLSGEAAILADAASALDAQALALTPPMGAA